MVRSKHRAWFLHRSLQAAAPRTVTGTQRHCMAPCSWPSLNSHPTRQLRVTVSGWAARTLVRASRRRRGARCSAVISASTASATVATDRRTHRRSPSQRARRRPRRRLRCRRSPSPPSRFLRWKAALAHGILRPDGAGPTEPFRRRAQAQPDARPLLSRRPRRRLGRHLNGLGGCGRCRRVCRRCRGCCERWWSECSWWSRQPRRRWRTSGSSCLARRRRPGRADAAVPRPAA